MSLTIAALPVSGALPLADWGLIRAQGADARSFLHGQLTQDVNTLQPGTARLAGYCTAKGRLLATFVMWAECDDAVLLACSADLLPAVLKLLRMFVLRAKCKLDDVSAEAVWAPMRGTPLAASRPSHSSASSSGAAGAWPPNCSARAPGRPPAPATAGPVSRLWLLYSRQRRFLHPRLQRCL